jgi:hypothetical protein
VQSFRLLAGGQFTSTIGDYCYAVALPWLVLSSHGGTILLGTVLACYGVPRTVLIPVGGAAAILGGLTQREFREFGALPREPKERGAVWTEKRGTSDEGRERLKSSPEASGK